MITKHEFKVVYIFDDINNITTRQKERKKKEKKICFAYMN